MSIRVTFSRDLNSVEFANATNWFTNEEGYLVVYREGSGESENIAAFREWVFVERVNDVAAGPKFAKSQDNTQVRDNGSFDAEALVDLASTLLKSKGLFKNG